MQGRLMGLDLGSKTIGLALCDAGRMIASPLETIIRTKFSQDATTLQRLITTHQVGGLVMGYPIQMDGTEGARCQSTRQFLRNLNTVIPMMPVLLWDERLSSLAVERVMLDADLSRSRRGELVDKLAASYILQGALDRMKAMPCTTFCHTREGGYPED
jgi:putative Holliday junction resolvase